MTTHLVIGDSHAKSGTNLSRFTLAGRLAVDRKVDKIINMGDWFDMPSLSSYDKGKKSFEGRRYNRDIQAGVKAQQLFQDPIDEYNLANRSKKQRKYSPRKIALKGNHEQRMDRAVNLAPELEGRLSDADFGWEEAGWEFVNYNGATPGVYNIDGVLYAHYLVSGLMGNPIGGEHPAASVIKKQFASCVVAHSHVRDFSERTTGDGRRLCALVAGCFLEDAEDYAGEANKMWWPGLVILHGVHNGEFDPEFISMKTLRKTYG